MVRAVFLSSSGYSHDDMIYVFNIHEGRREWDASIGRIGSSID